MKNILLVTLLATIFAACNNRPHTQAAAADAAGVNSSAASATVGSYVGAFGDNKITLLISRIKNDTVEGRSVVGGNDRPFSGKILQKDGIYQVEAREPGDAEDDGVFSFSIDSKTPDRVSGTWTPFNKNKTAKSFVLQRKAFTYRTDVGDFPEASQRELKPGDVENLMRPDLEWMRNEIFARHGYCFQRKTTRQQFEPLDWYVPNSTDIRKDLTDIEKKNIALIRRYEKYAEDYGDDYGR